MKYYIFYVYIHGILSRTVEYQRAFFKVMTCMACKIFIQIVRRAEMQRLLPMRESEERPLGLPLELYASLMGRVRVDPELYTHGSGSLSL